MLKRFYELTFQVTETCNNGNERTMKKTVLTAPFYWNGNIVTHNSPDHYIPLATKALEEQRYYHIQYLSAKVVTITVTDDFETWNWNDR